VIPFASLGQWETWRAETAAAEKAAAAAPLPNPLPASRGEGTGAKKLGYKDQREYDAIEETLARAEAALSEARAESERPDVASDHAKLIALLAVVDERQAEVDRLYARWAELEAKLAGGGSA
jgi:ATP-binding cassette subfamily F protein uup